MERTMKFNQYICIFIVAITSLGTAMSMEESDKEYDNSIAQGMLEATLKINDGPRTVVGVIQKVKELLNSNEVAQLLANDAEFNEQLVAQMKQKHGAPESYIALRLNTNGAINFLAQKIKRSSVDEKKEAITVIKVFFDLAIRANNKPEIINLIRVLQAASSDDYVKGFTQYYLKKFLGEARNFANPELILPLTIAQIDLLIDLGAKLNEPNQKTTPLMFTIASKSPELVKLLIENGADVNLTSSDGLTPLEYAKHLNVSNGNLPIEIFRLLHDHQKKKLI